MKTNIHNNVWFKYNRADKPTQSIVLEQSRRITYIKAQLIYNGRGCVFCESELYGKLIADQIVTEVITQRVVAALVVIIT